MSVIKTSVKKIVKKIKISIQSNFRDHKAHCQEVRERRLLPWPLVTVWARMDINSESISDRVALYWSLRLL